MSESKSITLAGIVEAVNDRGFKVGGVWVNYSTKGPKVGSAEVPRLAVQGEKVHVEAAPWGESGRQYIRKLVFPDGEPAAAVTTGHAGKPDKGTNGYGGKSAEDRLAITRQSAMKSAVGFVAAIAPIRPAVFKDFTSHDLFKLAERIEAWLTRPVSETPGDAPTPEAASPAPEMP